MSTKITSTRNIKPTSTSTASYSLAHMYGSKYGEFKYGARKYGVATEYSAGQIMPKIDTRVI
jgi:hypothetical protein